MEINTSKFSYHIESKPAGGFIARPSDPGMETIEGATREEVQQKIQDKITTLVAKQLPTSFKWGSLNLTVNAKTTVSTRTGTDTSFKTAQITSSQEKNLLPGSRLIEGSAPIVPSGSSGAILRVIAGLIAVAGVIYFFLHR